MCEYTKYAFCIQYRPLLSTILYFYVILSQSIALRCYVSGPAPYNGSIADIPLQECHPKVVSCMTTVSWVKDFSSYYCSTRKCTTKTGVISNTSTLYNTTDDSLTIHCCYTDGCNSSSSLQSFKPSSSVVVAIIIVFVCIKC